MRALLSASQVDKHFISVSRFEKKPAGTDAFLLIPHANRHGVGRLLLRPPA